MDDELLWRGFISKGVGIYNIISFVIKLSPWNNQKKIWILILAKAPTEPYFGRFIGPLTQFAHGIKVSNH